MNSLSVGFFVLAAIVWAIAAHGGMSRGHGWTYDPLYFSALLRRLPHRVARASLVVVGGLYALVGILLLT